jgi:hypothetical protein
MLGLGGYGNVNAFGGQQMMQPQSNLPRQMFNLAA